MSVLIRRSDAIAIIQNADYKYPTWPHIFSEVAAASKAGEGEHV